MSRRPIPAAGPLPPGHLHLSGWWWRFEDDPMILQFRRAYAGRLLLIVSGGHGWGDFVRNNLIPSAPPDTVVCWSGSRPFHPDPLLRRALLTLGVMPLAKRKPGIHPLRPPVLYHVGEHHMQGATFHQNLAPLKAHAKRDAEVRDAIGRLIDNFVSYWRKRDARSGPR